MEEEDLQEVVEEWLLLKLRDNEEIPPLGEISLARRRYETGIYCCY